MTSPSCFIFTQRHYDIIIKQTLDNLPQESGGFLGGKDNVVMGIMPTHNQHLYNRTDTFAVTSDDMQRAYEFFAKNGLTYFGLYHSHPKGVAYPSPEDIRTGQRYHFIVSWRDPESPVFAAYEIIQNEPHQIPIKVESDSKYSVKDLTGKASAKTSPIGGDILESARTIGVVLDRWRAGKSPEYPRMPPKQSGSDFSTLA
jgi:proteasome lid subunit RPN8/RPN11